VKGKLKHAQFIRQMTKVKGSESLVNTLNLRWTCSTLSTCLQVYSARRAAMLKIADGDDAKKGKHSRR